jgi:hypothetical protein
MRRTANCKQVLLVGGYVNDLTTFHSLFNVCYCWILIHCKGSSVTYGLEERNVQYNHIANQFRSEHDSTTS